MNQLIHPRYDLVKIAARVRVAGFEPALSRFRTGRISQAFPHPERSIDPSKYPAGVEPALPPWQGGRLPLHHGYSVAEAELSKKTREHRVGLEPTCPRYGRGILAAG
jgi:hypothetical protein